MKTDQDDGRARRGTGAIPVHCAHSDLIDPKLLKGNPRNPNRHPPDQINLLCKVIKHHGWRVPITISKRSRLIVRGHGRLEAALALGLEEVPVDYQEYGSEADEMADLLADNKLPELAYIDRDLLGIDLEWLKDEGHDLELAGFLDEEQLGAVPNEPPVDLEPVFKVIIKCESEQHQLELLKRFDAEGLTCQALML